MAESDRELALMLVRSVTTEQKWDDNWFDENVDNFVKLVCLARAAGMREAAAEIAALRARVAELERERAISASVPADSPEDNWLAGPSLDWLENCEHGDDNARCKMIADMLRFLWSRVDHSITGEISPSDSPKTCPAAAPSTTPPAQPQP